MSVLSIQYSNDCIRFVSDSWFTDPNGTGKHLDAPKIFGDSRRIFSATGMVPSGVKLPGSFATVVDAENFLMSFSEAIFPQKTLAQLQAWQNRHGSIHSAWLAGVTADGELFLRGIGLKLKFATPKHSYYKPELTVVPQLVASGGSRVQLSGHNDAVAFVKAAIEIGVDCGGAVQQMRITRSSK